MVIVKKTPATQVKKKKKVFTLMYTIGTRIMIAASIQFALQWIFIKGLRWTYPNHRALKESCIFYVHY